MIKINHLAIWAENLEQMREFYLKYFGAVSNEMYVNPKKGFSSYFLTFEGSDTALELMHRQGLLTPPPCNTVFGLAHFAISLGSKGAVDNMTRRLKEDGYAVLSAPRTTGDGFYESAIADPEGNYVELTV